MARNLNPGDSSSDGLDSPNQVRKNLDTSAVTQADDNRGYKKSYGNNMFYFLSFRYLCQWCYIRKKDSMARRRLGQKISYLSLYEYAFIVDKHEEEMAELKQKLSKMRRSSKGSRRQSVASESEYAFKSLRDELDPLKKERLAEQQEMKALKAMVAQLMKDKAK